MSTTRNVLIGGGTGFIGTHLCNALKKNGHDFTIISRMPGPKRISWSELQANGLPNDISAVVNLAGQNVMDFTRRWTSGFKQNVFNSRINTTISLAKLINEATVKPSVFVSMSGVGAYKPDPKIEYCEDSICENFDFFSQLCKRWEKAATLNDDSKDICRVVTIRSGVVLGKEGGIIKQLYLPFSLGLGGPVGDGTQYMPWIHIDDLTALILFAIENEKIKGIVNGVAPQPCTNLEFTKALSSALNRPAVIPLPSFILNLLLNKERAVMITEGQKVIPQKAKDMGFKYVYPNIEAACNAIIKSK